MPKEVVEKITVCAWACMCMYVFDMCVFMSLTCHCSCLWGACAGSISPHVYMSIYCQSSASVVPRCQSCHGHSPLRGGKTRKHCGLECAFVISVMCVLWHASMLEAILSLCACIKYSISVPLAYYNALVLDGSSMDLSGLRGADIPYAPHSAASSPANSAHPLACAQHINC